MAKRNYKYNCEIDLSNLPKTKSGYCDWSKSIGLSVPFVFDNKLKGEFIIVDYKIPDGLTHKHLYVKYENQVLKPILPSSFKNGKISNIIDEFYIEWGYEIGQRIVDDKRDITIIDRKRIKDSQGYLIKTYKYHCNICGFDCGEHYFTGERIDEFWVTEYDLKRKDKRRSNCSCCSSSIIVPNINDITTLAPWMIDFFIGDTYEEKKNNAKKYSANSGQIIDMQCPDCGRIIKNKKIVSVYKTHNLTCVCNDNISYPNKVSFYLLEQLSDQLKHYEREYSPEWIKPYKYDNYFILNNDKEYILEMDGELGHGNKKYGGGQDIEGIKRDKYKDQKALEHNITVIRIDCKKSELNYIKNNLLLSLSDILDLENVDWNNIELNARKNLYKMVCDYYNENKETFNIYDAMDKFKIGKTTIYRIFKNGKKFGWCDYIKKEDIYKENFNKVIEYWNKNKYVQTSVIAEKFNISQGTVVSYLNNGVELNICDYNPSESMKSYFDNKETYPIFVFDLQLNFIKQYKSSSECETKSMDDFGIQFCKKVIDNVCLGKNKTHKGYYFSRTLDIDKESVLKRLNTSNRHTEKTYVYTLNYKYCGEYNSIKELCENSLENFGIKFNPANVSYVCTGNAKQHKGYIFTHKPIENHNGDSFLL